MGRLISRNGPTSSTGSIAAGEMMIPYCLSEHCTFVPCGVGWGSVDSNGMKSCTDQPHETNCHYLVDGPEEDDREDPLFFTNAKEAYATITGKDRERARRVYPPVSVCGCEYCQKHIVLAGR